MSLLNLSHIKVLMDKHNKPKIYDLSQAKSLSEPLCSSNLIENRSTVQDRIYLAPEIMNSQLNLPLKGDKIDVFAFGVMLFTSLYKSPPFKTASLKDPFFKLLSSKNGNHQDKFFKSHPALRG